MIKWSIVLVPFPFDDFSETKIRPALCLTSEIGEFSHVIIAFITSKVPDILMESHLILQKDSENQLGTGLKVESAIRLHKLVTIPKSVISRRLGRLDAETTKIILAKIKNIFGNSEDEITNRKRE